MKNEKKKKKYYGVAYICTYKGQNEKTRGIYYLTGEKKEKCIEKLFTFIDENIKKNKNSSKIYELVFLKKKNRMQILRRTSK